MGVRRQLQMEYGEVPPLFLNAFPLSHGVVFIMLVHLVICVSFVATVSSIVPVSIYNYVVSPDLQVLIGAWHLLGITLIIGGLIGVKTFYEFPVRMYFYFIVVSNLAVFVLMLCMVSGASGTSICDMISWEMQSQRVGVSFRCGWLVATWVTIILCFLAVTSYCGYMVYHWAEFLNHRDHSLHLLAHESEDMKAHRAAEGVDRQARQKYMERHELEDEEEEQEGYGATA
mmetsp:Transcript_143260/g.249867  ORF Transcript_143260/g.249867 Transcript_143260/m.249867 type:complete len:229 (-) Transcript_143260:96-782(-)